MRRIEIGFSKPKNKILPIFSWLIRLYEGTKFSHVFIRWQTSIGPSICYHFEISDEQYNELLKYCLETCGSQYGLIEVLGIPIMELFNLKSNPFSQGEREQYCAELVARAIGKMSGDSLPFNPANVRLKELNRFVKNLNKI